MLDGKLLCYSISFIHKVLKRKSKAEVELFTGPDTLDFLIVHSFINSATNSCDFSAIREVTSKPWPNLQYMIMWYNTFFLYTYSNLISRAAFVGMESDQTHMIQCEKKLELLLDFEGVRHTLPYQSVHSSHSLVDDLH